MLLSGLLIAQTENLIYDQLIKTTGTEFYHTPVGLCEDYPEETTTPEILRADLEFLKTHGVKFMRISFGWDAIEVEKDKFDWLFWDDFVKMAVDDYQITLIPYVCYTPQWISTGKTDTMFFWNYPPEDYERFGVFMKQLVTRFKDRIKTWELWNEPDISIYWKGTVGDFARFTKIGARAVREADPDAKVVLGGLAYKPEFTLSLFRDHGISEYVDIVNMHNYYETWHRHPVESIVEYVNEISDIVWRYGDGQSLWMAEVGYSTFRQGVYVSDSYNAYYDYEHTPEYQAVDLFKRLTLVITTGKIAAIAWYELKDLPQTEEVIGDNYNNRHLGVAYVDYSPKPSAKALQFFNTLFNRKSKCIDKEIILQGPVASDSELHGFETEDGRVILIGWLKTSIPGRAGGDKSGMVKDDRHETISVYVKKNLDPAGILYNEIGNKKTYDGAKESRDGLVIENLALTGGAIKILEFKKK